MREDSCLTTTTTTHVLTLSIDVWWLWSVWRGMVSRMKVLPSSCSLVLCGGCVVSGVVCLAQWRCHCLHGHRCCVVVVVSCIVLLAQWRCHCLHGHRCCVVVVVSGIVLLAQWRCHCLHGHRCCVVVVFKQRTLVYDILPSTTAVFSYDIGPRKLSANEQ